MSLPSIRDIVIYKTRNRWSDVTRREKRKVIRLLKNNLGQPIIEWESSKNMGICMPSTWQDWCDDVNENEHRGASIWRSTDK